MRKLVMFLCALGILGSTSSFADTACKDKYGTLKCGQGTVGDISYTGFVEADGTTVTNSVNVFGSVTAINSHLNVVVIKGESHLAKTEVVGKMQMTGNISTEDVEIRSRSKITGDFYASHTILYDAINVIGMIDCNFCLFKMDADIAGHVTTKSSEFINTLTLNAKNATFSDTKLNDIFVKKPSDDEVQTINLSNGSRANNISFENQKGVVILSGNSQLMGSVQGGKVVKTRN
ncbi:MAG: hypothetical protein WAW86_09010 [Gammaproteobacteria bacterium]